MSWKEVVKSLSFKKRKKFILPFKGKETLKKKLKLKD